MKIIQFYSKLFTGVLSNDCRCRQVSDYQDESEQAKADLGEVAACMAAFLSFLVANHVPWLISRGKARSLSNSSFLPSTRVTDLRRHSQPSADESIADNTLNSIYLSRMANV